MAISNEIETGTTLQKHASGAFGTGVVLDKWLPSGVTISSVSVLDFTGDDDLTISNAAANSGTYTRAKPNESETYSAGKVIEYDISGGVAGTTYRVPFKVTLSNADELVVIQPWTIKS